MPIFNFTDDEALGCVISVDTATVTIRVDAIDRLRRIQVNRLTVLQSSRAGQHLIGIVTRITRRAEDRAEAPVGEIDPIDQVLPQNNLVRITLIGTLLDRVGMLENVFRRTLETVPEIDSNCFALEGERLTQFMQVISNVEADGPRLSLGSFTLDDEAVAYLNGNKLFQRHAVIVGCRRHRFRQIVDDSAPAGSGRSVAASQRHSFRHPWRVQAACWR